MVCRLSLSTEELLHETPVELIRLPDIDDVRGDYRYSVIRRDDGQKIGDTRILHFANDTKELNRPYLLDEYLGQGYGLAMYVAASRLAHDSGINAPLQSQLVYLSDSAKKVWESLVARELAFVKDQSVLQYQFKSTETQY